MSGKKQGWLNREPKKPLHPLLSILLSVLILTLGFFITDLQQVLYYALFLVILTITIGYIKTLLQTLLIFVPIGLLVGLISFFTGKDISGAILSFYRFSIMGFSVALTLHMDPAALSRSLNQIGCPRKISLAILVVFRFIPILKEEVSRIKEAMKVRGIDIHWYNPLHYYRVIFLPLLIKITEISDLLTLSLETRAFDLTGKSTIYKRVLVNKKDIFALFFTLSGLIFIIMLFWT